MKWMKPRKLSVLFLVFALACGAAWGQTGGSGMGGDSPQGTDCDEPDPEQPTLPPEDCLDPGNSLGGVEGLSFGGSCGFWDVPGGSPYDEIEQLADCLGDAMETASGGDYIYEANGYGYSFYQVETGPPPAKFCLRESFEDLEGLSVHLVGENKKAWIRKVFETPQGNGTIVVTVNDRDPVTVATNQSISAINAALVAGLQAAGFAVSESPSFIHVTADNGPPTWPPNPNPDPPVDIDSVEFLSYDDGIITTELEIRGIGLLDATDCTP